MTSHSFASRTPCPHHRLLLVLAAIFTLVTSAQALRADEPFARSRDYDLQHSKIILKFDTEHKKVIGEVVHTLSTLHDDISKITFDSSGLTIQSVAVNKSSAKFEAADDKLNITVAAPKAGTKLDIDIHYEGVPSKGLYFILPDKDYPKRPIQIWSQGESQDTHYYIPTYDYPNDRLTTETVLTVPASWQTVANGKLVGVSNGPDGMKTWTWKESQPSSTYLITVVAGELDEVKDSYRNLPVTYYAPKGRGDRLAINYSRTPAMIELFNKKFGVDYAWEKYAQVMVDDFVAGGMENSSATTNTATSLVDPRLAPEYTTGQDDLISHELAHQWFGDLVTCKDWGDIWLNEGFATFGEKIWQEGHFPKEQADYVRWEDSRQWFAQANLYKHPIVRFDFDDSSEFDQNVYDKGGWVLQMLRHQLGDEAFFRALKHYLEVNRGKNVVTADFIRAVEESTNTNVDQFFNQWVYGAGAPKFDLSYKYDDAKHQIALTVKQLQKIEGRVSIFTVPVDVEITTSAGPHLYPMKITKATETFTLPASSEPLMVVFDRGGWVLKTADFHKDKKEWIYQLKHGSEFSDRADAAVALRAFKYEAPKAGDASSAKNEEVVEALAEAASHDPVWGIRVIAGDNLGQVGGPVAARKLLEALDAAKEPWVRNRLVTALGEFKNNKEVIAKLQSVAAQDSSWRARAAAVQALGKLKAPDAYATLNAAIAADSPDDIVRNAALRSLGVLGDDKAVPVLREWVAVGKPMPSRAAAIASLARLQKDDKDITLLLASFLSEPHFSVRMAALFALGPRHDVAALPALEELLKSNDLSIEVAPLIKSQIAMLKKPVSDKGGAHAAAGDDDDADEGSAASGGSDKDAAMVAERLEKLEQLVQEMSDRLKSMEARLPSK